MVEEAHRMSHQSVHPRACGEHELVSPTKTYHCGSSPRLRGTSLDKSVKAVAHRFIPAPAGNIGGPNARQSKRAVHPRACGEHYVTALTENRFHGSSPRLRGTSPALSGRFDTIRFIPAPAGNMPTKVAAPKTEPVHPRACGEHNANPIRHKN